MARTGSGALLSHRNVKLDSFLKRNTERTVYERIRASEPCVVLSESIRRVYMHVVLSDERVYLTEYPPRTLTEALSFRRVRDIKLVNDLPDFLHGKDRELCQHIRITYITDQPAAKHRDWLRRDKGAGLPAAAAASRRPSHSQATAPTPERYPAQRRSASCPNPETLGLLGLPPSTASPLNHRLNVADTSQEQRTIASLLSRLLKRDAVDSREEREAELHLYATSQTSRLYLHLQSSWSSFIIRSTLSLESASPDSSPGKQLPAVSWERTAHLFGQLSSELLQEGISVESLYLLLQELRTAARRNIALRRLFWRSSEVCVLLLQTLEESLHAGDYTADQLLLSTVIVQTLSIMFRETEVEPARLHLLSAKRGALASRMLLALICGSELRPQKQRPLLDCELQALLAEYLDAACSLLFELLLFGQEASRYSSADNFLSVGWILRVLQPHPHLSSFVGHQAQQVVLVLSDQHESFLSPVQSVLLFQRCHLLLAILQYNKQLAQHLRSHFGEEFRYFVKPSCAEVKLPPHYPISQPTLRLVEQILAVILHR